MNFLAYRNALFLIFVVYKPLRFICLRCNLHLYRYEGEFYLFENRQTDLVSKKKKEIVAG